MMMGDLSPHLLQLGQIFVSLAVHQVQAVSIRGPEDDALIGYQYSCRCGWEGEKFKVASDRDRAKDRALHHDLGGIEWLR